MPRNLNHSAHQNSEKKSFPRRVLRTGATCWGTFLGVVWKAL